MLDINIVIEKLILHILDNTIEIPVLSEREQPLNFDIMAFIEKHIEKVINDGRLKDAEFIGEQNTIKNLCMDISQDCKKFAGATALIASNLFDIMKNHVDIPSADVVFCLFKLDQVLHLGILKFNYKYSYIHDIQTSEDVRVNCIIKQKTTLPSENQRIDECAIINLDNFSIKLLEKKYEVNGEKAFYFSEMFLKCTSEASSREKIKLFTKATEKFTKKYFEEDFIKHGEIKKAVAESIEDNESINVEKIAENVFRKSPELKEEYIEQVEKTGLKERDIPVDIEKAEKKFRNQKLKTDTGIEIKLPTKYYGNNDKIEFINNTDGTISILIKNVGKIISK